MAQITICFFKPPHGVLDRRTHIEIYFANTLKWLIAFPAPETIACKSVISTCRHINTHGLKLLPLNPLDSLNLRLITYEQSATNLHYLSHITAFDLPDGLTGALMLLVAVTPRWVVTCCQRLEPCSCLETNSRVLFIWLHVDDIV